MKTIWPVLLPACFALFALPPSSASDAPTPRPNFLFAIADDWSYGHASAYGCRWVKTPAFEKAPLD